MSEQSAPGCTPAGGRRKRGIICRIRSVFGEKSGENFIVIGSDVMGKEPDIGAVLMKGFLETIWETDQLPQAMFFLNAGVKLTTQNEDTVSVLKDIADAGVEIFSCGTCLKHYGLEDELKVGFRGTTAILVEYMADAGKTVFI